MAHIQQKKHVFLSYLCHPIFSQHWFECVICEAVSKFSRRQYSRQKCDPTVTTWLLLQGDWVWLKKFEEGHFREVKQSTTKIFTKVEQLVLLLDLFGKATRFLKCHT